MTCIWYVSKLVAVLPVGFLEKWDQCVTNALKGESFYSMHQTRLLHDHVIHLVTGPLERLKVQYSTLYLTSF